MNESQDIVPKKRLSRFEMLEEQARIYSANKPRTIWPNSGEWQGFYEVPVQSEEEERRLLTRRNIHS